jgi:carboxypeptidase Taq
MTTSAAKKFEKLLDYCREIEDLGAASGLMHWDQETYMPKGGGAIRARQLATLSGLIHRMFVSADMAKMLDSLGNGENKDLTPLQNKGVAELRRQYDRAVKVPESMAREIAETESKAMEAWKEARAKNDFPLFAPWLKKVFDLERKKAELLAKDGSFACLYDALHDSYEPYMTKARLTPLFNGLRDRTIKLLKELTAVSADKKPKDDLLHRAFDESEQWKISLRALRKIGYDMNCGRQDKSTHPFSTGAHPTDIRVTTRVSGDFFNPCFFAALHEGGHALYEQGLDKEKVGELLAMAASLGMHESQSRLWENLVGRSRSFWRHMFPIVQYAFDGTLEDATDEDFYRAVNTAQPSLIRVEADEVTYNLHVILRFELETALLEGAMDVNDLPKRWNEKFEAYLGIVPPTDAEGCLQDMHWAGGAIGYFPTYTLGNLYSVPIYRAAEKALGNLDAMFERGELMPLRQWLRENIHSVGRSLTAEQIAEKVSGKPLDPGPYMDYLETKYRKIYGLS